MLAAHLAVANDTAQRLGCCPVTNGATEAAAFKIFYRGHCMPPMGPKELSGLLGARRSLFVSWAHKRHCAIADQVVKRSTCQCGARDGLRVQELARGIRQYNRRSIWITRAPRCR